MLGVLLGIQEIQTPLHTGSTEPLRVCGSGGVWLESLGFCWGLPPPPPRIEGAVPTRAQGASELGFRVSGFGFRVSGFGFRV